MSQAKIRKRKEKIFPDEKYYELIISEDELNAVVTAITMILITVPTLPCNPILDKLKDKLWSVKAPSGTILED